jgi:putative phosphoribosyl transferase
MSTGSRLGAAIGEIVNRHANGAGYEDRIDAGRRLGRLVAARIDGPSVVLAIPRAGVQVGAFVAAALHAPLVPLLVRKVGLPEQPETVVGAIDADGALVARRGAGELGLLPAELEGLGEVVAARLQEWRALFGAPDPAAVLPGHTAVLVDDQLVTGLTARAGVEYVRRRGAERIVVAVPVGRADAIAALEAMGVEVVAPVRAPAGADLAAYYRRLPEVTLEEVAHLLARAGPSRPRHLTPPLSGDHHLRLVDSQGISHPAALRLPDGIGPSPAVVLVGPGAAPGEAAGERAALRLAEAGLATVRLAPQPGVPTTAVLGLALDVLASRPELDPNRLGLLGLREAGVVAVAVAEGDRRVGAVALVAPPEGLDLPSGALVVGSTVFDTRDLDRIARWFADRFWPAV